MGRVNDLLSSPIHVLCIAGPDAGVAFAARDETLSIGRDGDVQVLDRFTSRVHLLVTGISSRRGIGVQLEQVSASNSFAIGRLIPPLPGFARTWVWLRTVQAQAGRVIPHVRGNRQMIHERGRAASSRYPAPPQRAKTYGNLDIHNYAKTDINSDASGDFDAFTTRNLNPGAKRFVGVGGVFQVGANIWQVRARPATMSLKTALEASSSVANPNRRMLYLLLPLVSLLWMLGRFAGWEWAIGIFVMALAVAFYVWRAWRSHRAPLPRWGILFGLCLPARGTGTIANRTSLDTSSGHPKGEAAGSAFGTRLTSAVGAGAGLAASAKTTVSTTSALGGPSRAPRTGRTQTSASAISDADRTTSVTSASTHRAAATVTAPAAPRRSASRRPHAVASGQAPARTSDWILDLSESPTWHRVFRLPAHTLARIRFRQGPRITVQSGECIALNGYETWGAWALAQALVCARADGIDATIYEDEPNVLSTPDGTRLLTVLAGDSASFGADHRVECGPDLPLQVRLPLHSESLEAGTPSRVLVDELPAPVAGVGLAVPIGMRHGEPVFLDLVRDGPHTLVAGTTGSGKSETLRTWILQMCRLRGPRQLRLVLIDYKGGAAFRDLAQLPHVEGMLTDLQPQETARAVAGLAAELQAREEALAARGFASIDDWENHSFRDAPARIICVIDEFRAMIRTHPDTLEDLVDLAARGRSLGMHLIAATQSPGGVVTPAMRANLTLRICLRTASAADSFEMLGADAAAVLPRIPGRAIVDAGDPIEIQWAQWTKPVGEAEFSSWKVIEEATGSAGSSLGATKGSLGSSPCVSAGSVGRSPDAASHASSTLSSELDLGYESPRLWLPALPEVLSTVENENLRHRFECVGEPFAWLDKIPQRTYAPLVLGDSKVAVVGNYGPVLDSIASASNAVRVSANDGEVVDTVHQLEMARLAGRAVVIEDLGALLRAVDGWGAGLGQEWWRSWSARTCGIAVGVGISDFSLVRSWSRTLLAITAMQARSLGLSREATAPLVAFPWDGEESVSASLVAGKELRMQEPIAPVCSSSSIIKEVRERAGILGVWNPVVGERDGNTLWLVGDAPESLQEQLVGEVRREDLKIKRISEAELVAGHYRPSIGDVSVFASASRHALRSANLPAFVAADLAGNGGIWVGICEAWYRIKMAKN